MYLSRVYEQKIVGELDDDPAKQFFLSLPKVQQNEVYKGLIQYYSITLDAFEKDVDPNSPSESLRHCLKWMGLATDLEIFNQIGKGSLVEMFDASFRQIWRSSNFFKHSSHSIASLHCRPFNLNFRRECQKTESKISQSAVELLSGKKDRIHDVTDSHAIYEVGSPDSIVNFGRVKYASTLIKGDAINGIISVIDLSQAARV
jgi:hypothetical protein